jgi:hypothetical protein
MALDLRESSNRPSPVAKSSRHGVSNVRVKGEYESRSIEPRPAMCARSRYPRNTPSLALFRKLEEQKLAALTPSADKSDQVTPVDLPRSRQKSGRCTSISQRCALQIGGRCDPSTGKWDYGRNGSGGNTLAFNTCIGESLARHKR